MAALHDGTVFDIRRFEILPNSDLRRLTVAHHCVPKPGSQWVLSPSTSQVHAYDDLPSAQTNRARKSVLLFGPDEFRKRFNEESRSVNTSGMPATLRDLVKKGDYSLAQAQNLVMKNEVPLGVPVEVWTEWRADSTRNRTWEDHRTGLPCRAETRSGPHSLASMLKHISPTNSVLANPNAAVREAFVALVVRATGLSAAQADAYILSGGLVTVISYEGEGWARVALATPTTSNTYADGSSSSSSSFRSSNDKNRVRKDQWEEWCSTEINAGRTLMVQLWHHSLESEDNGRRSMSGNDVPNSGSVGTHNDDKEAATDVKRNSSGSSSSAKWIWQQVLEVPLTTTVASLKEDLVATNRVPASMESVNDGPKSAEHSDGFKDHENKNADARQRVRLVYAGRPLIDCRVAAGAQNSGVGAKEGGNISVDEQKSGDSAALEATLTLGDLLLDEVERRVASGHAHGHDASAVCHLCGLAVASVASLKWHLSKCLQSWQAEQRRAFPHQPELRRQPPRKPALPRVPDSTGPLLAAWNRQAALIFLLEATPRCPGCRRNFVDAHTLTNHMARCCPQHLPPELESTPFEMRLERLPFEITPEVERKEREDDIDAFYVAAASSAAGVAIPSNVEVVASSISAAPAGSQTFTNDEGAVTATVGAPTDLNNAMNNANKSPPIPQQDFQPPAAQIPRAEQSLMPPAPPTPPASSIPPQLDPNQQASHHDKRSPHKMPTRSLTVVRCYICDHLTGLSSIAWHHKRCTQSFHARNNGPSVPPILRRALAEPPSVPLPSYKNTALHYANEDEELMEDSESREMGHNNNDSTTLASQIAAYNAAARRVYFNEVRFHCPACGDGIDDDSDVLDYEQHLGIEYDEWGVPNENNNIELAKLYSIGLGVSVQQHLSVCCPDVLAHAQDQVLDMKSSNRGRHKQHDYGGEHDSFDGGGPLRGWLCVGCGRHFGRAGYGWHLAACRRRWCAEAKAIGLDHHAEYARRGNYAVRFSFAVGVGARGDIKAAMARTNRAETHLEEAAEAASLEDEIAPDKISPALQAARLLLQSHGQRQLSALLASAWTNQAIPPWGAREGSWLQSASEMAAAGASLSERDLQDAAARDEATAREAATSQPGALALVGLRQVTVSGLWLYDPSTDRRISLLNLLQRFRLVNTRAAATARAATAVGHTMDEVGSADHASSYDVETDNDNDDVEKDDPIVGQTVASALKSLQHSNVSPNDLQLEVSISVANLRSLDAARAVRSLLLPTSAATSTASGRAVTNLNSSAHNSDEEGESTMRSESSSRVGPVLGSPSLVRFLGAPCRLTLSPPTNSSVSLLEHPNSDCTRSEDQEGGQGEDQEGGGEEGAEILEESDLPDNSTKSEIPSQVPIPAKTLLANTAAAVGEIQSSTLQKLPKAVRILRLPPPSPPGAPAGFDPLHAWRSTHKWARPSWAWRGKNNMTAALGYSRSRGGAAAGQGNDGNQESDLESVGDGAELVVPPQFVRELIAAEERWFNLKAETTRALYVLPRCPRCESSVSVDDGVSVLNLRRLGFDAVEEELTSMIAVGANSVRSAGRREASAFRSIAEVETAVSRDLAIAEEELSTARCSGSVFETEGALRDHMSNCCREVLAVESALHAIRQEALLAPGGGALTQSSSNVGVQGIVCYLCGRSTPSSTSFGWHLRACVTRWQVAEFAKPTNQRRPLPKLPRHVKLPGPKPKLLLASASSSSSSSVSTANAARDPRQLLLPEGSSESRAAEFSAAMSKWQAQVHAYNEAALTLSSELSGLQCARCVDTFESLNRKRASAEANYTAARAALLAAETANSTAASSASAEVDEVAPELSTTSVPEVGKARTDLAAAESVLMKIDASLSKIQRSFKSCKLLLLHMDKCCPQDIPQHSDGDVRSALEALKNPFDLMVLIAETRDARRKRHKIAHERIAQRAASGSAATTTHSVAGPASVPTEGTAAKFRASLKNNTHGTEAEEVEWTSLQRRIPLICYLCNAPSASLAGLDFHRRACLRQWDRKERLERPPHRCRLFGWRKSDPDTQFPGEKYGTATFFWDVPSTPSGGDLSALLDGKRQASDPSVSPIALLREPKRRLLPGPVPAPPRAPLPPYPPADLAVLNRSNNYSNSGSSSSSSSSTTSKSAAATSEWAGDAAYNAAAETYNAEARHIFQDWTQWACPNWRPVIIRLGPKAIQRVVDAFHDAKTANAANSLEMADPGLAALLAMGLEVKEVGNGGTRLVVESFHDSKDSDLEIDDPSTKDASNQASHVVRPNDALWTISVLSPREKEKATTKDHAASTIAATTSSDITNISTTAAAPSSKNAPIKEKQMWSTRRIYAESPSSAGLLLAETALECCDAIVNHEETPDSREGEDASEVAATAEEGEPPYESPSPQRFMVRPDAKLAIVLRRGCSMRFATEKLLNRHLNGIASSSAPANKGCDRSGAIVAGRTLLAQDHPPDPNRDQPVNPDEFKGTVCFICNQRVLYMGSLARHAAKCFMAADALQTAERPSLYRDPPPKPPEHVYGRAPRTVTVWKDANRRKSSASSAALVSEPLPGDPLTEGLDPSLRNTEIDTDSNADTNCDLSKDDDDDKEAEDIAARDQEIVSVRQDSALRARIARYKAGHTIGPSTVMEWRYDVKFAFFAAFYADQMADAESLREAFAEVVLEPVYSKRSSHLRATHSSRTKNDDVDEGGDFETGEERAPEHADEDGHNEKETTVVLRVVRCKGGRGGGRGSGGERPSTLPLVVGDQIMVCWHDTASSSSISSSSTNQKSPFVGLDGRTDPDACSAFLTVPWGDAEAAHSCPWPQVLGALQPHDPRATLPPLQGSNSTPGNATALAFMPFSVRLRRSVKAPLDRQRDLCPAMTLALREWDRRCAALFIARHPRCGKRQVLTRTLHVDQLNDSHHNKLSFVLTSLGCPEVEHRVADDEGDLFPGDELTLYGPPGAPESTLSLAHGCLPSALLQNLRRVCAQSPTQEVVLHFVRRLLRPAHRPGIGAGLQWCEKLPKVPDEMTPAELRSTLARMRSGGIEEATEDGSRIELRDRLEALLKGGCGRSFATQSAALKHMKHCCPNIIEPYAFEEPNPVKAASKDLAFHGDRGLGGVYVEETQWPYGEPGWVCYLCAKRTCTLDSFKFHLLSCARAWDNYELTKHSSRWKPPPKAPCEDEEIPETYGAELQAYNTKALAIHTSVQAQCAECGKTFKDEPSLDNHMASCCPQLLFQITSKVGADRDAIGVDRTVPCYVCGRRVANFLSVPKHIASCLRRWYNREKEKPQPHLRLPPPAPPALPPPTNRRDVPAYRAQAQAVFENSLPRCNLRARYSVRCTIDLLKDLRGSSPFGDDSDSSSSSSSSSSSDDNEGDGVSRGGGRSKSGVGRSRQSKSLSSAPRGRLLNLEVPASNPHVSAANTGEVSASATTVPSTAMMMATITKRVPLEIARKHGLKRGDLLVAITGPSSEANDVNLLYGTTKEQGGIQAIFARIEASALAIEHNPNERGEVWFERRCGMTFAEEDTMLKHQAKCKVDLVAGLEAGLDNVAAVSKKVNNEEDGGREEGVFGMAIMDAAKTSKSHPGQPTVVGRAAAQLYRQHPAFEPTARSKTSAAVRSGIVAGGGGGGGKQTKKALSSNSFEPATHRRVPVFGDSHNRFAPGARRRRNEDAKVAAENAQFASRLDKVKSTLPKPASHATPARVHTTTATKSSSAHSTQKAATAAAQVLPSTTTTPSAVAKGNSAPIKSRREAEMWKESKRVQDENERLGKALRFLYGRKEAVKSAYGGVVGNAVRVARYYEGYGLHPTGKTPAPQTDQWEARTRIYTHPPANAAAATASASTDTRAVSRNGSRPSARGGASNSASMAVPKTLGVAQCGGCAKRAFSSGSSGGGGLRRCQRVELPELLAWTEAEGLFGDRCRLAAKLLGLNPKGGESTSGSSNTKDDQKVASFGGGCCKSLNQSPNETPATADDVPWYCDDACALAGWLSHRRVCFHAPTLTGHGGLEPSATDPWVLLGSKFKGGVVGATRRLLQPSSATVAYPSGQTESNVPIDRLVPHDRKHADSITTTIAAAAETPPPPPSDDFAWIVPTIRARLLKVSANGHERRVPVEIVSVAQKPSMKELLAAIGSMMLQDPLLLASVGEGERAEKLPVVEEEGLRCYYCYDEVYADATYQDHIAVCAARWRRMEARKPLAQQRPEPQPPLSMARPSDVHDQPLVAAWAEAVKEVMPRDDGSNPNGGGALGRSQAAEERAGATAQKQQLEYALKDMDTKVVNDILALEALQQRLAWEKTGGLPASSLPPRRAPHDVDNGSLGEQQNAMSAHAAWAEAHATAEIRRISGRKL